MENITTERLVIRRFAEADRADFLAYQGLPDVRKYMAGGPMTEEQAVQFLARQAAAREDEKGRYHAFAVWHRGDRRVIGDVGFYLADGPEEKGDLGFQFHPDYHGQGYAHEAAEVLIRHGFLHLELRRITSSCDARNTASFRLMERLGLRREGLAANGEQPTEYRYALLRDEWLARQDPTPRSGETNERKGDNVRYMQFHRQGEFEGILIEEDTVVSYGEGEAVTVEAAAAVANIRPGESAWPVQDGNFDAGLLVTYARARALGVIPRPL